MAKRKNNTGNSDATSATVGKLVDDAMTDIERDNPALKGVLPKNYARPAPSYVRSNEATVSVVIPGGEANFDFVRLLVTEGQSGRVLGLDELLILFNRRLAVQRGPTGEHRVTVVGGETIRAFLPHPLPPKPPLDLVNSRTRLLEQATLVLGRRRRDFAPCPTQTSSLCRASRREHFM
ncbi:hypothetical protein [Desulfatirhabdium butyrativorans]|uniref:hypothetical protein n=1 Tax=Desulfatirhabdium butyrativorans TaxID=340467 RepID=UPI0009FCCA16|nr:hypothetical protein [Desulfatirhabdium butyrativorans]